MKKQDVVRAWRDPKYRRSLSSQQKAQLPTHPAEWMIGVEDDVLASVTGGCGPVGGGGCGPMTSTQPFYCSAACTPCPPLHCY